MGCQDGLMMMMMVMCLLCGQGFRDFLQRAHTVCVVAVDALKWVVWGTASLSHKSSPRLASSPPVRLADIPGTNSKATTLGISRHGLNLTLGVSPISRTHPGRAAAADACA